MDDTCPACGQPLERADDFWYCDNPDCPRGRAHPVEREQDGPGDGAGRPEAPRPSKRQRR